MKKKVIVLIGIVVLVAGILFVSAVQVQTPDTLEEKALFAARLGGEYLVRNMYDNGLYMYKYDVSTDTVAHAYNMLRHSGTTYALYELYEVTDEKAYRETADRAIEYLKTTIAPCPGVHANLSCAYDGEKTKLGGNALAILALLEQAKVTNDTMPLEIATALAQWMKVTQTSEGEFPIHIQLRDGSLDDHVSEYYPGEAIYALASLYEATGDEEWLAIAEKAATWLIEVRDSDKTSMTISHDHWLLYGLHQLYLHTHEEKYLTHAKKIVDGIIAKQHITEVPASWVGGYYNPPRSTPTATRSEGLGAAYDLFLEAGDDSYASKAYETLRRGVEFQLRTFIDGVQARTYKDPVRSLGGFRYSLEDNTVRIDYVQHNISSLLMFYDISNR